MSVKIDGQRPELPSNLLEDFGTPRIDDIILEEQ